MSKNEEKLLELTSAIIKNDREYYTIADSLGKLGVQICTSIPGIQVFSGIEKLAEIYGHELTVTEFGEPRYPTKKSFVEQGLEFFELVPAEME